MILLVEDDDATAEALVEILQDEGHVVCVARDGEQAFRLLERGIQPAVIVLDLWMPVMDGLHFRNFQRNDPRFARIPVLLISASCTEDVARQMGVTTYFSKPFELIDFLQAIRALSASQWSGQAS